MTNVLWFTAVHRVGPGRATLFSNLQPFLGALFAVVLLSEPLTASEIFGGALIATAIFIAGPRSTPPATAE